MKNRSCHILPPPVTVAMAVLILLLSFSWASAEPLPGGTLKPETIPQYTEPLIIPPVLPPQSRGNKTLYQIALRQRQQQILPTIDKNGAPTNYGPTPIWSYANFVDPQGGPQSGATFNYPSFTVEVRRDEIVRVRWVNELVDKNRNFLPHLLEGAVDQTLHWANPPMDCYEGPARTDCRGDVQAPYTGPVPMVPHVHGAHVDAISDGYPEAWWLPNAKDIPKSYATQGSNYGSVHPAPPGSAWYEYDNSQPAATLWFHDHTLGMTRLNVYAGPAGFWLIRDEVEDSLNLPGPAPVEGEDPNGDPEVRAKIREIPIAIQDRSFNYDETTGETSLFYPSSRLFFEQVASGNLDLFFDQYFPFFPEETLAEDVDSQTNETYQLVSDVAPIWNPEFFGNTMVVNGHTWPYYNVEPEAYRLRLLNGCNSRFLILMLSEEPTNSPATSALPFTQIGSDSGLLPSPVIHDDGLLLGPAERADVIVDFSHFAGKEVYMINLGPDEPFGGGVPEADFDPADSGTTGQVMKFIVAEGKGEPYDVPSSLRRDIEGPEEIDQTTLRKLSLNEEVSSSVCADQDGNKIFEVDTSLEDGANFRERCEEAGGEPFAPVAALLGTFNEQENPFPMRWAEDITETPELNDTETWEIYNYTADAHPIHLHLVTFKVVNRQPMGNGEIFDPEPNELGYKDTVIAYPGEITRIQAKFDKPGLYVWHCHILEHEDNEMMRPLFVKEDGNTPVPEP